MSPGAPTASPAPRAATAAEARIREETRRIRTILSVSAGSWQPPWVEAGRPQRPAMKLTACAAVVGLARALPRQRAPPHQQGVLGAQAGSDHLRPVGGDDQRDAGRLEPEDDLGHLLLVAHGPGPHVRGGADLEHHPALERLLEQARLHRGDDPVADAVHAQVQHLAHLLEEGPRVGRVDALLAGVQRHPQAGVPGALHQRGQVAVGVGRRGAAEVAARRCRWRSRRDRGSGWPAPRWRRSARARSRGPSSGSGPRGPDTPARPGRCRARRPSRWRPGRARRPGCAWPG